MKPSASKARVAARVAKHRQRVKDKAEMNRQQQANLDKMDVPERILYDMTVSALLDSAKAQMPAKVAAVIAKAEIKARKEEEQLTTVRTDSDGKIVREPMRDRNGEVIRPRFASGIHAHADEPVWAAQDKQRRLIEAQTNGPRSGTAGAW